MAGRESFLFSISAQMVDYLVGWVLRGGKGDGDQTKRITQIPYWRLASISFFGIQSCGPLIPYNRNRIAEDGKGQ